MPGFIAHSQGTCDVFVTVLEYGASLLVHGKGNCSLVKYSLSWGNLFVFHCLLAVLADLDTSRNMSGNDKSVHICTHACICVHAYIHTYIHILKHTYTHTHTHTHT